MVNIVQPVELPAHRAGRRCIYSRKSPVSPARALVADEVVDLGQAARPDGCSAIEHVWQAEGSKVNTRLGHHWSKCHNNRIPTCMASDLHVTTELTMPSSPSDAGTHKLERLLAISNDLDIASPQPRACPT
jgi:hypothetical protein